MELSRKRVRWALNEKHLPDALMQKPLTIPVRLNVGHPYSHTAYDNVTVSGVLDPQFLQKVAGHAR